MSLAAELNSTTVLTPRERERQKTAQQRAEDVIYTLNHTFTCLLATDLLIAPVLRAFGMNIGHSHGEHGCDHGHLTHHHNHKHNHDTHDHAHPKPGLWQRIKHEVGNAAKWRSAKHWFYGEFIGDVGAAIVTIPVQRFLPGLMDGIRRVIEPVAGGFFHRGATRASHKWADQHGLNYNNQEVVDRAQKIYEYEMRHLPQMAMWTLSSIGLHYGAMRFFEKISMADFARQKAATAAITAAVVFGARAMAPDKAHWWDETAGKYVVLPLTKKVGKLFGVKDRDVDDYHARQINDTMPKAWADRVKEPGSAIAEAAR